MIKLGIEYVIINNYVNRILINKNILLFLIKLFECIIIIHILVKY